MAAEGGEHLSGPDYFCNIGREPHVPRRTEVKRPSLPIHSEAYGMFDIDPIFKSDRTRSADSPKLGWAPT